jgi:hypothetical protein
MLTLKGESMKKDPLILPSVTVKKPPVRPVESPVVTIGDIPDEVSVGDKILPKATVLRADGTTPIVGCPVDFFVKDSLGVSVLGDRVKTDSAGVATATEAYYVGKPDAGTEIEFTVITRPVVV